MDLKKRERSANFNTAEIQLLVSLVEKYKYIIENKKTDAVTNKDKESAWEKIENAFNSCGLTTSVRSWKTLKLKYEGIKKTTKKKSAVQRQEMYRTGGGLSSAPEFNIVEEKVLSICSNIKGLEARHDSDCITIPITDGDLDCLGSSEIISVDDVKQHEPCDEQHLNLTQSQETNVLQDINITEKQEVFIAPDPAEPINPAEEDTEPQKENNWDRWHPKALKSRVSNVLRTDKAGVTAKLEKLSVARLELVQLQMETVRKEQKFMEEEHKLKMLHLLNDEKRKQDIHKLLTQKINSGHISSDIV